MAVSSNKTATFVDACRFMQGFPEYREEFAATYILNCVLNALFSVPSVIGNCLVLVAIWKTPSLHLPAYVLLCGLAVSDLAVGLFSQPLYVAHKVAQITGYQNAYCVLGVAYSFTTTLFSGVSFGTMTAISIDRSLALHFHLRYKELVTVERALLNLVVLWLTSLVFASVFLWNFYIFCLLGVISMVSFDLVAIFAYVKIYRVVKRHQAQIHAQEQQSAAHRLGNSSQINMALYKKSVRGMVSVYCLFLVCYAPYNCLQIVILATGSYGVRGYQASIEMPFTWAMTIIMINSALNPFLYCWRMRSVREAVFRILPKALVRKEYLELSYVTFAAGKSIRNRPQESPSSRFKQAEVKGKLGESSVAATPK